MIFVIRIAGQVKNKIKDNETMKRLKLNKKFTAILVDEKDVVKMGMVNAVSHKLSFGKVNKEFIEELNKKRQAKDGVYFMHPPRGGFKKNSKVAAPKGILGKQEDITKLAKRML